MQILLPFVYLLLLLFLIGKMKFFAFEGLSRKQLCGLFLIKCAAGMAVWLVYTYYYTGSDFQLYFSDSKKLFDSVFSSRPAELAMWNGSFDDSSFNNSRIVICINVLLQLISFNNIFVHILFFCFFSFVGLTAVYKTFRKYVPEKNYALVTGIYLVPSALFWTAGIYKETVAILFMGLLIAYTEAGLRKEYSKKQLVISALLFLALFLVKIYIAAALVPVLLINFLYSRSDAKKMWLKILFVFIPLFILVYAASMISDRSNAFKIIADKRAKAISEAKGGTFLLNDRNFICVEYYDEDALLLQPDSTYRIRPGTNYLSWEPDNMQDTTFVSNSADSSSFHLLYGVSPSKTVLNFSRLEPTFISVMSSLPAAIWNVLVQPTLFGISNILHLCAAIENLWLLLLIVLAIVFFDKKSLQYKEVLIFCVLFALIQFAVIGLTTPAVGAMIRYRSTALPFLVMACLLSLDLSKPARVLRSAKKQDS
jgi:uncharacterized membrane protein